MMYDFRSPTEYAFPEELSVQTIINGLNLDKTIKGFRTLAVKGRELHPNDISTKTHQTVRAGGGNRTKTKNSAFVTSYANTFLGVRLADKSITVEYDLKAKDNRAFREQFELLNYYLNKEEARVVFTDDPDFYYTATLSGADAVDGNGNWVRGSFELICSNPFKRRVNYEVFRFDSEGIFKKQSFYPVLLEVAAITLKESTEKLILVNRSTGKRIILDGQFEAEDCVMIDFMDGTVKSEEGLNLMTQLDITSNLESFGVAYRDVLGTNVAASVEMQYREVRL